MDTIIISDRIEILNQLMGSGLNYLLIQSGNFPTNKIQFHIYVSSFKG